MSSLKKRLDRIEDVIEKNRRGELWTPHYVSGLIHEIRTALLLGDKNWKGETALDELLRYIDWLEQNK